MSYKKLIPIIIFITLTVISLFVGVAEFTFMDVIRGNKEAIQIIFETRFPRTLTIILSSASLGISGLIIQTINRNKYISPSTMGTTAGSQLGLLIMFITLGSRGHLFRFIFGFVFAMATSLIFINMIKNIKARESAYIPLIGLMYSSVIASISLIIASKFDLSQWAQALNIGTFSHIISYNHYLIYLTIIPLVSAYFFAAKFTIVGMGESFSSNVGINYKQTMYVGLTIVSVISSVTFIIIGSVPLFGLIVPNIVSLYYGDNLKNTLPSICLFSGILLLICDIFARTVIFPFEMPISIVTSVLGSVVFLILILKRRGR